MIIINKQFLKKILITFVLCIIIINVFMPTRVYAWDIGGVLFKPVFALTNLAISSINTILGLLLKRRRIYD